MVAYRADGLPLQVEARKIELIGLKAMLPNTPKGKSRKLINFPAARKAHKSLFQIARSTALCAVASASRSAAVLALRTDRAAIRRLTR